MYFVKFRAALRGKSRNPRTTDSADVADGSQASDTDALQLDTRFGPAPFDFGQGKLSRVFPIRVIRVIRGWSSLRGEGGDDFFEARVAAQRIPPR
jgi:hypothetical protein